jgi:hypothetical protein
MAVELLTVLEETAGAESKFVGHNRLFLCKSDTMAALEWYLNTVLLRAPVSVTNITERTSDGVFEVYIKPQEGKSK